MPNKLTRIFGYLLTLIIVFFLLINTWFANQSINHKSQAAEFLETVIQLIVKWDIESLQPFFDHHADIYFKSERGVKRMAEYSKLGKLNKLEPYQYTGSTTKNIGREETTLMNFSMLGHFENAKALIIITVSTQNDDYYLHQIIVNSNVLFEN